MMLVIAGSVRAGSSTERAAGLAADALLRHGAAATTATLGDLALPPCDGSAAQAMTPPVRAWRDLVRAADALVFVTPEWHASMSGPLKNALDHLSIEETTGRAAAFVSQGGGRLPARGSLDHLRAVACSLRMWPIPTDVALVGADLDAPPPDILARLDRMARELLRLSRLLSATTI